MTATIEPFCLVGLIKPMVGGYEEIWCSCCSPFLRRSWSGVTHLLQLAAFVSTKLLPG